LNQKKIHEISTATIKTSKTYKAPVGRFSYHQLKLPYYSYGIKSIAYSPKQTALIASPEKALCDKIVLTPRVNLRSIKQTQHFLLDDLRMDSEILHSLNLEVMETWIENASKKNSLNILIKTLRQL